MEPARKDHEIPVKRFGQLVHSMFPDLEFKKGALRLLQQECEMRTAFVVQKCAIVRDKRKAKTVKGSDIDLICAIRASDDSDEQALFQTLEPVYKEYLLKKGDGEPEKKKRRKRKELSPLEPKETITGQ